ncbi:MAG: hypothetical protein ACLFM8_02440 [Halobacteriales archaeon]
MSAGAPRREVAHRLFAAEFADATVSVADADEEMAPTYVLAPTGALVNRAFVVGVLTEVDQVGADIYRGRVNDPTGTFVAYAGQYQPKAANFLADAEVPTFVALTGKARTFQPEGSDRIYSSLRPERVVETTRETRDRWVTEAARHTLGRIELVAQVRAEGVAPERIEAELRGRGVEASLARGIARAIAEYDVGAAYLRALRDRVVQTLEVVLGEREAVDPLSADPGGGGDPAAYEALATGDFAGAFRTDAPVAREAVATPAGGASEADDGPSSPDDSAGAPTEEADAAASPDATPAASVPEAGEVDVEAPEFELSAEERAAVEEEYGTDFATGDDIESPASPPETAPTDEAESTVAPADEATPAEEDDLEGDDLEATVVAHMHELDEGEGVDRTALVEAVEEATSADRSAIDDAIHDALMSGSCYEPSEGRLKPI